MSRGRWALSLLAFSIGGQVAIAGLGGLDGAASGWAGGLVVGLFLGAAQWWALRSRGSAPAGS